MKIAQALSFEKHLNQYNVIHLSLRRKILMVMPKSFPDILSYEYYEKLDKDKIQMYGDAAEELKEKMLQTADKFLKV